jgi:hypothetical protein
LQIESFSGKAARVLIILRQIISGGSNYFGGKSWGIFLSLIELIHQLTVL